MAFDKLFCSTSVERVQRFLGFSDFRNKIPDTVSIILECFQNLSKMEAGGEGVCVRAHTRRIWSGRESGGEMISLN